jgi:hypothetical protein
MIDVVGPKSVVARATTATTEPITLTGANSVVRETVTVGTVEPLLRLKVPRSAAVTIQIVPVR